ncbi:MAG: hypothetical protein IPN86_10370 [Saprospiraceae bacterium]|nr:hypothetical protein [Saprospiraceae bacterium]
MRPNLDTLSLQQKLEGYINESSAKLVKNVTKSNTLKYVLPFAAAAVMPTVMSGQCGLGTFNATGGYYSDGQIDVNGDGNPDFDFDIAGNNLWMTVVGTMDQGQTNAAASQAINGAFPAGWDINIYNIELIGDVTTTATFYVPIRDGAGNLGFIEITTGGGTFTINLANSGVGDVTTSVNAGDCASILPVELSSFDVKAANRNLALSWTTASEVNNFGFEVQRSMDGIGFQKIG